MKALIVKEFRELARDRRTLAMLIALPVLLLVIFGYAANFSVERVQVIVVGPEAETVSATIASNPAIKDEVDITRVDPTLGDADAQSLLKGQEANAVVVAKQFSAAQAPLTDRMHVYIDGSSLFSAQATEGIFMQVAATQPPTDQSEELVTVLFNPDLKTSWVMVPGLLGLILLFIGALITSIGLVRERETGTLEQLAVMPLRPSAIILGKIIPYFLLALVDMAAVTALGVWLFGVPFVGSLWLFSISALVFLLVVLGIGVLISSVSQSTGQAIQMAILFVVPQVLLSGLIFPLDAMPLGVRWIGYILPLTWFREIAQGVMLRGADLTSLWLPLTILAAMAIVAFGASTARMRHTLTHGGAR
ncbi:Inner membrane transport permease YbhR [Corynebacterium atrinae]|uniref:ABC transporter permease n=1 Tax=Corynebacterium atrinae TaxID=1336740 RepID=UPI0025B3C2C4|nr:ABC transporter permease [Corynebacterium atrinae]WJY64225.1 Inner membrane transport permease YbhR [Corynebacterium atrinae]